MSDDYYYRLHWDMLLEDILDELAAYHIRRLLSH